jgi:hypothetical protein
MERPTQALCGALGAGLRGPCGGGVCCVVCRDHVACVLCGQDPLLQHSYCYLREEVEACIDCGLMPMGVFDICGGAVGLGMLRRREEAGFSFRGTCQPPPAC